MIVPPQPHVGSRIYPGTNVGLGRDHTLYARMDGIVQYEHATKYRRKVSVYAEAVEA